MSQATWHIYSAVVLRRMPLALPKPNIIEQRVQQIFNNYEVVRSKLSNHELRRIQDQQRAERMSSGEDLTDADIEAAAKQTAQDFEDQCHRELAKFESLRKESIEQGKDLSSCHDQNKCSLLRHYDRDILLVARQHFGPTDPTKQWLVPQARLQPGETLIDCGRRALSSLMSFNFSSKCAFAGKLPVSVYRFNYPRKLRDTLQATGAQVFFMRAYCPSAASSCLPPTSQDLDYHWLTREECSQTLKSAYWRSISNSLFTEGRIDSTQVMNQVVRNRTAKLNEYREMRGANIKMSSS